MERIVIIDHFAHKLIVEDVDKEILIRGYNGSEVEYIEDNYTFVGDYSWEYITDAEYIPNGDDKDPVDIVFSLPIMMEIKKKKKWLTIEKEGQRVILKKCALEAEGEIVIPEGVECISERAFQGCSSITSIIPSKSLKEIGNYAFLDCYLLKSFIFPEGLERIGDWAFYHTKIYDDSVSIPEGVELGKYPFEYPDVKDIRINTSVIDFCLNHELPREVEDMNDFVRDLSIAIPDWKEQIKQKYFWHVFRHRCRRAVVVYSVYEYILKEKK